MKAAYFAFTAALGLLGWVVLITAALTAFGPTPVARPEMGALLLFAVVIVLGRTAAVRTAEGQVLALDGAFYVAAAVCVGSVLAGGLVALALTIDAGVRLMRAGSLQRQRLGWWGGLCYVVFFGGATGALVLVVGWLFDLDSLYLLVEGTDAAILARLLVAGGVLVLAHYALQAVRVLLSGGSIIRYWRRVAIPGAIAETALMPLAAIIVYVYEPESPLRFVLLGATYIVINFAFNRIYATSMVLRRRVKDLEILNETSRGLAASLQGNDVLEAVALAVTRAIEDADEMILVRATGSRSHTLDRFRVRGRSFERAVSETPPPEVAKVLKTKNTVRIDVSSFGGAWLGVPLSFYGRVEGVLAVKSPNPSVFGEDHQRLLESIGGQAAVALKNAELYELAMVDGLTGLFVRRYFDARLEEEILRSKRFDTEFSVVMMDVDNFKALNDRYGHIVGDRVLKGIAKEVRGGLRGVDTGARYGGEEISMILPRTPLIEAYNVAERIRQRIEELAVRGNAKPVRVTASFGIASYPESGATSREDLVRRADKALYRAKRTGKNRVELFWADTDSDDSVTLKLVDTSPE